VRRWLGTTIIALAAIFGLGASPPPQLPFALLDSFDQAMKLVTAAAEKQIAEIEARSAQTARAPTVSFDEWLDRFEQQLAGVDAAAHDALDRALVAAPELSPQRREAVLDCIESHLAIASDDLSRALDGRDDELGRLEVAEYRATFVRLRAVRALVTLRATLV
jgi:hypothetical protein